MVNLRFAPSRGLLQYLKCATSDSSFPRSSSCARAQFVRAQLKSYSANRGVSIPIESSTGGIESLLECSEGSTRGSDIDLDSDLAVSSNGNDLRQDSLDFLISSDPPEVLQDRPSTSHSRPLSIAASAGSDGPKSTDSMAQRTDFVPIRDEHSDRWLERCKRLIGDHDFKEFQKTLELGMSNGLTVPSIELKKLCYKLLYLHQHDLVLRVFSHYENECANDKRCVTAAIKAAHRSGRHDQCERIFSKYCDILQSDAGTLDAVLSSFIADANITVATAFLNQIWDSVKPTTIVKYIDGCRRIAKDIQMVFDVFSKWKSKRESQGLSPSPEVYSAVLEAVCELGSKEQFSLFYDMAAVDGLQHNALIENVLIQRALRGRDYEAYRTVLDRLEKSGHYPVRRSFAVPLAQFAKSGDFDAVEFIMQEMSRHDFELTSQDTAHLLLNMEKSRDKPMLDNLRRVKNGGAEINQSTILKATWVLIKSHPHIGRLLQKELERRLFEQGLTIYKARPRAVVHKKHRLKKVYLHVPENPNNTMWVMRELQKVCYSNDPAKGIRILEDLARRGVTPSQDMFMTVLRGLARAKIWSQIGFVMSMMRQSGHQVTPEVKLFTVQIDLDHLREGSLATYNSRQSHALKLISTLYDDIEAYLGIVGRTQLGRHLLYWKQPYKALCMFDSLRHGGQFTAENHDCDSLRGMIRSYQLMGDPLRAVDTLSRFLSDRPAVFLHKQFLFQLRSFFERLLASSDANVARQVWSLYQKCEQHNDLIVTKSLQDTGDIAEFLADWAHTESL